MKVKTFVSAGHDLEAAMEGLEEKINGWLSDARSLDIKDLKYLVVELNGRPYATAMVMYGG